MDEAETSSCGLEIQQIPFYCGRGVVVNPHEKCMGHLFSGSSNKIMMQSKLVSFLKNIYIMDRVQPFGPD